MGSRYATLKKNFINWNPNKHTKREQLLRTLDVKSMFFFGKKLKIEDLIKMQRKSRFSRWFKRNRKKKKKSMIVCPIL